MHERGMEWAARHWRWIVVAAWIAACAWFIFQRWNGIAGFALGDTDDNMRMSQVRALLAGQDWFDLRQYKLGGPEGADIHWSRLVDLPLAGLILAARPFVGGADAERFAVAVAPLLPLLLLLFSVALTVRRLIAPAAYLLAFFTLFFAGSTNGMFVPTRIDHHGWQLALLALAVSGLADPKRARGGLVVGLASALSLTIGLEMLIYLALAGGATVLFWVVDRDERRRLAVYAATLGGGTALGFLLFASNANRMAVCDALSPVWLGNALIGAALMLGLAMLSPARWPVRLALAAGAGLAVAGAHALLWPHCLSRLEGASPELERLWLSRVREARPIYRHGWQIATLVLALPITGAVGWALIAWRERADREKLRRILATAILALAALALLFWQTRAGPAAQLLAVPGAVALGWWLAPLAFRSANTFVLVLGTSALVLLASGAAVPLAIRFVPAKKVTPREREVARANRLCPSLGALRPVALMPKGTVFTFVDLAPRVITVTHHRAIIGPYHRNSQAILDVYHAFGGSAAEARVLVAKYDADYLLICPSMSESTNYAAKTPKGFYVQLAKGQTPPWLTPLPLPKDSPFKMWKVER